ncbi:hypothetical protein PAECIP111893_04407 [Paenibacillus plantiphilus]|uniref:Cell wall elongation regulator TseB-like domain-containing protein n=1 Tax=Paenibacillus plantiphilus TaxID=2905650 RepID=A0ABM9CNP1_9BACL|nr:DUF5590 domain-containing protein [Paenibacillus plantiphilus]CAH1218344.1 hypothetical protein PAECIP111893_04407 [Paenibacillus plantiphilus]
MRAKSRKREPVMTPLKWTLLAAAALITIVLLVNGYYRHVQSPLWEEERAAEKQAIETAEFTETADAHKFVWDETLWVVEGKDKDGDEAYVWLKQEDKDKPLILKVKEGVTAEAIEEQFNQSKPDADMERVTLGMLNGEPVWEVFYYRKQAGSGNYYYDFYRFKDGSAVTTYKLPSQ